MVSKDPEIAGLRDGLVGWLGDVVGVGQSVLGLGRRQCRQHGGERLGVHRDVGEELLELRLVGRRHGRERVETGEDEPLLLG